MFLTPLQLKKNLHLYACSTDVRQAKDRAAGDEAMRANADFFQKVLRGIAMIFQATGAFPVIGDEVDVVDSPGIRITSRVFVTNETDEWRSKGNVRILFSYDLKP